MSFAPPRGTSEHGIERSVAGYFGLAVGGFSLKKCLGGDPGFFHDALDGDWTLVIIPGASAVP